MRISIFFSIALGLVAATPNASELHDPPGHKVLFKLRTEPTSVQIYTCKANAWTGPDPDAIITGGKLILHHYKGPTWESTDGSVIRGSNAKHWLSPREKSIDWLELTASGGTQAFAKVDIIHRIETSGGVAPVQPCDAAHEMQQVRVPYTATYVFYTPGN